MRKIEEGEMIKRDVFHLSCFPDSKKIPACCGAMRNALDILPELGSFPL
jgi:hypothetical protein